MSQRETIATVPMGKYASAQGPIIETHPNGEVTISSTPTQVKGFPVGFKQGS